MSAVLRQAVRYLRTLQGPLLREVSMRHVKSLQNVGLFRLVVRACAVTCIAVVSAGLGCWYGTTITARRMASMEHVTEWQGGVLRTFRGRLLPYPLVVYPRCILLSVQTEPGSMTPNPGSGSFGVRLITQDSAEAVRTYYGRTLRTFGVVHTKHLRRRDAWLMTGTAAGGGRLNVLIYALPQGGSDLWIGGLAPE